MRRVSQVLLLLILLFFGSSQKPVGIPADRLLQEARILYDSARYEQALQRGQEALAKSREGEVDAAECMLLLGDVFLETGQWEAAQQQFKEALSVFTKKFGLRHLSTAVAFNRIGECFYKKTDFKAAASFFQKALIIRIPVLGTEHELVADVYNNLGNCQVGLGFYANAVTLHEKALAIRQRVLPTNHPDLATSFNNLGNCAYLSGDYHAALSYFGKALTIREIAFGTKHPKTAQILNNLGNACASLGQRNEAIRHYHRALEIRRQHFETLHPALASTLENIADLYFENGDYIAALDFFRQAYAIQREVQGEQSEAAATLWHSIGLCYQYEGDFDQALTYHLLAEPVLIEAFGAEHPQMGSLYNNLGNCYAGKKSFAHALVFYKRARQIFQTSEPQQTASLALVYNNEGMVYLEKKETEQALTSFQKSVAVLRANKTSHPGELAVYLKNMGLALERLNRWPEVCAVFEQARKSATKADPMTENIIQDAWATVLCQRGTYTGDTTMLLESIAVFDKSRERSDSLRVSLSEAGSRQRWTELQFPALASAMEACYRLWEKTGATYLLEKAFALAERNKSMQLLEQLHNEQAEQLLGIPDSLLEQEHYWSELLNQREKALLYCQQSDNTAETRSAAIALAEARQALSALLKRIEQHYPDYFRLRYERQTASIKAIQQQVLGEGQTLLEYFVSDSAIFVFVVTPSAFCCQRLARDFPLDEWVSTLRHSLQAYPEAGAAQATEYVKSYVDQAYQLYEAIFAPVQKLLPLSEKLIIVPDGTLCYLPFECLLQARPTNYSQFKSHHYLIRDHCCSYAQSATQQLALLQRLPTTLPKDLLAIAPTYEKNRYGLAALQNNQREAKSICDLLDGQLLEGSKATVPMFLQNAAEYRVLLLAMHGKASSTIGDMSYLAFGTGADTLEHPFLFARDLYTQSIPADLVVLSACETSVGAYRCGQGVISLAKGFFQAGARSVAATLWSVDDARNSELIQLFFKHIKKGEDKDGALRNAKLEYLLSHPQDEANPVYWAAVTIYGDMRKVDLTDGAWGWAWWIGLGLALLIGYFLKR
jgi:CHAT domain-containing protein/tetratricopeptide (TPR) repeat protein